MVLGPVGTAGGGWRKSLSPGAPLIQGHLSRPRKPNRLIPHQAALCPSPLSRQRRSRQYLPYRHRSSNRGPSRKIGHPRRLFILRWGYPCLLRPLLERGPSA